MAKQSLDQYGIIGNTYTTALVGLNGSIDWLCSPQHDSPSMFAALLDDEKGGYFRVSPVEETESDSEARPFRTHQLYWPSTNVLITRFLGLQNSGEIIDFMPLGLEDPHHRAQRSLVRMVKATRGSVRFQLHCFPAFNYAQDSHETTLHCHGAQFISASDCVDLSTSLFLEQSQTGVVANFELAKGEMVVLMLQSRCQPSDPDPQPLSDSEAQSLLDQTLNYWQHWLSQSTYRGRWQAAVERSALLLKLLTYGPSGAIIAAPTTSLPESLGSDLNWDYRYVWVRDSAYAIYALIRLGFNQEAAQFIHWIRDRCAECTDDGLINVVYSIDGKHEMPERLLPHLKGYQDSYPVRVGNAAYQQFQLDIYGAFVDAVYLHNKHGEPISYTFWQYIERMLNWLCDNWHRPDQSIWEPRDEKKQFVHSKVMCWVALDRGLRLAEKRSFPHPRDRWMQNRDQIYREVMEKGWDESQQSFVQSYGSQTLDASNLIMSLVFFLAPQDPRMLKMIETVLKPLEEGGLCANDMVYRHNTAQAGTGVDGEEGTFSLCTLWLVEALTRAGRHDHCYCQQAQVIFEKFLGLSNHLGLFAEEIRPDGQALGNFPQVFTHLALISAALNLDQALDNHPS